MFCASICAADSTYRRPLFSLRCPRRPPWATARRGFTPQTFLRQAVTGEDATLSAPATVDLAALFNTTLTAFKIKTVEDLEEVSLTNNQPKALIIQKRAQALQWSGNGTGGESAKTHAWRSAAPLD